MSNDEVNRKISEFFEPKPTEPLAYTSTSLMSPKGIWRWEFERGWQGSDYFTDEAANARLVDALREDHFKQAEADFASPFYTLCIELMNRNADRKTAVVMSFLKFAGIET